MRGVAIGIIGGGLEENGRISLGEGREAMQRGQEIERLIGPERVGDTEGVVPVLGDLIGGFQNMRPVKTQETLKRKCLRLRKQLFTPQISQCLCQASKLSCLLCIIWRLRHEMKCDTLTQRFSFCVISKSVLCCQCQKFNINLVLVRSEARLRSSSHTQGNS